MDYNTIITIILTSSVISSIISIYLRYRYDEKLKEVDYRYGKKLKEVDAILKPLIERRIKIVHETTEIVRGCKKQAQLFIETFDDPDVASKNLNSLGNKFENLFLNYATEFEQDGIYYEIHQYKTDIIRFKTLLSTFNNESDDKEKLNNLYKKIEAQYDEIREKLATLLPHWDREFGF